MGTKTKIDWCDSTWNPVTGCLRGCAYCYARRIAERFGGYPSDEKLHEFNGRQMHVCPLQLDIVDRLINRYSAPGETVFDPFGGLMTVPVEAVRLGREGIGTELNADYFRDGLGYLREADAERDVPTLFDLLEAK